ncbi:unnamed protein product [Toxocara canis]|uniref:ZP domain-containing protein n=1 Tax=Toxocara canis TaxID=6265 RepID=A0A183U0H8_TOXCA|nr:unnamed protein product [Toxocara canis]
MRSLKSTASVISTINGDIPTAHSALCYSVLRTETVEQATMLMPNCEYSVRAGSVDGPRVRFSRIGDQLVHRWECDNPNYGMLVKNCFVNDGGGTSVRVLDGRGCPVFSAVVQGPLSYDNSLNLAFVPIWAYKFPDRSQLYFQCQIQPPNCPNVIHPDFIPNSLIDAGVDPTQVIGTFTNPHLLQSPLIVRSADQRIIDRVAINDVHLPPGIASENLPLSALDSTGLSLGETVVASGLQPARPYTNRRRELHPLHRNRAQIQDTLGDLNANTEVVCRCDRLESE